MEKKQLYKQLSIMFDLDLKKVKSNLSLNSIRNWDSLKQMELIFFIEKKIKKELKTGEIEKVKTIANIEKLYIPGQGIGTISVGSTFDIGEVVEITGNINI